MKIILARTEKKLGGAGQTITVADGYARNCLIPKGWAYPATEANLKKYQQIEQSRRKKLEQEKEEAFSLKDKLETVSCTVLVEAGEEEKIFGSVTPTDIAASLAKEGIAIDKKKIVMAETIRQLGVFNVKVKLHPEVVAEVKVWVMKH